VTGCEGGDAGSGPVNHHVYVDRLPPAELLVLFADLTVVGPGLPDLSRAEGAVVGMAHHWDDELLEAHPRLRVVSRIGIGIDNVDLAAATRHGVMVTNTPDGPSVSTAEHAVTLLLATAKRLPAALRSSRQGGYDFAALSSAQELDGTMLGLVGCGRIGRRVGRIATAIGMHVLVCDPYLAGTDHELVSFAELVARSDSISLHAPLTAETRHMFDAEVFAAMRPGAILVNCARGGLVDHEALLAALDSGQVGAAGLDVTEPEPLPTGHPLLGREDVIVTPHMASSTVAGRQRMYAMAVEQAAMALRGERPTELCNPEVWGRTR
jgi:phosphoglycerate dehydrogenase-like enzyme